MKVLGARLSRKNSVHKEKRVSLIRLKRALPPRMLWVLIIYGDTNPHVYLGWNFWSRKYPTAWTAVKKGKHIT